MVYSAYNEERITEVVMNPGTKELQIQIDFEGDVPETGSFEILVRSPKAISYSKVDGGTVDCTTGIFIKFIEAFVDSIKVVPTTIPEGTMYTTYVDRLG